MTMTRNEEEEQRRREKTKHQKTRKYEIVTGAL